MGLLPRELRRAGRGQKGSAGALIEALYFRGEETAAERGHRERVAADHNRGDLSSTGDGEQDPGQKPEAPSPLRARTPLHPLFLPPSPTVPSTGRSTEQVLKNSFVMGRASIPQ